MVRIAVLVSGGGTNLQALIDAQARGELKNGAIAAVISSKPGAYALERAEKAGIPGYVVARKEFSSNREMTLALVDKLRELDIGLVVLAGFMHILTEEMVAAYPNAILNVHPALIPSFCGAGYYGLHVHEAALAYGVKVTGATVHFVNEEPDGGPIVLQKAVEILEGDTPEVLQRRVMEQAEWRILPQAVSLFCEGRLSVEGRSVHIKQDKVQIKEPCMKTLDLTALLRINPYPGRGIVLGSSPDGSKAVIAYFIMGRSENSRNRVFVETPDGIRTQAYDPSKMTDPSLIIYAPVRVFGTATIVTNGDQTDTIREGLAAGKSFAEALRTRTFEPDSPNYTPRISGLVQQTGLHPVHPQERRRRPRLLPPVLLRVRGPPGRPGPLHPHLYGDGTPLPSFEGEPEQVAIASDAAADLPSCCGRA